MCYCPTPTLHLNLALTGDGAFLLSPQKTHSVWFISVLNYGDTENVLINHLLLVIPMSYPCHYTNLCPHKPHKHAHTHTHTHTLYPVFSFLFFLCPAVWPPVWSRTITVHSFCTWNRDDFIQLDFIKKGHLFILIIIIIVIVVINNNNK